MVFALVCVAAIATEAYVIFIDRTDTFVIQGTRSYEIAESADGGVVRHGFLMRGDGMHSLEVNLSSNIAADIILHWTLWRGSIDRPPMTVASEGVERLALRPGRQWTTLPVIRDGSSHDRWYMLQLKLTDGVPAPSRVGFAAKLRVAVVASQDNPDRGGVLWVNQVRMPGSLFLRAHRRGKTIHEQFLVEATPHLPAPFKIQLVRWLVAGAVHLALIGYALAVLSDIGRSPRRGAAS